MDRPSSVLAGRVDSAEEGCPLPACDVGRGGSGGGSGAGSEAASLPRTVPPSPAQRPVMDAVASVGSSSPLCPSPPPEEIAEADQRPADRLELPALASPLLESPLSLLAAAAAATTVAEKTVKSVTDNGGDTSKLSQQPPAAETAIPAQHFRTVVNPLVSPPRSPNRSLSPPATTLTSPIMLVPAGMTPPPACLPRGLEPPPIAVAVAPLIAAVSSTATGLAIIAAATAEESERATAPLSAGKAINASPTKRAVLSLDAVADATGSRAATSVGASAAPSLFSSGDVTGPTPAAAVGDGGRGVAEDVEASPSSRWLCTGGIGLFGLGPTDAADRLSCVVGTIQSVFGDGSGSPSVLSASAAAAAFVDEERHRQCADHPSTAAAAAATLTTRNCGSGKRGLPKGQLMKGHVPTTNAKRLLLRQPIHFAAAAAAKARALSF